MSFRDRVAKAIETDDMESLYSLAVECALIADKKSITHAIGQSQPYSVQFEEAWALYPRRKGANPKREAWGAWQARIRDKKFTAPIDLIQGVKRYRAFCEATGKVGTELVMQARRFWGPSELFRETWDAGAITEAVIRSDKPDFKYIAGVIEARKNKPDGDAWWQSVQAAANAANHRDLLLYAYRHTA